MKQSIFCQNIPETFQKSNFTVKRESFIFRVQRQKNLTRSTCTFEEFSPYTRPKIDRIKKCVEIGSPIFQVFSFQISNSYISISARNSYGGCGPARYIQIFDAIFEVRLTVFGFLISSVRKTLFGVIWVTSLSFFGPVKLIRVFSKLCRKKMFGQRVPSAGKIRFFLTKSLIK